MIKPDREPDYKTQNWHFYFEEMVQWNVSMMKLYKLRYNENDIRLEYYEDEKSISSGHWHPYNYAPADEAYYSWLVEKELLR